MCGKLDGNRVLASLLAAILLASALAAGCGVSVAEQSMVEIASSPKAAAEESPAAVPSKPSPTPAEETATLAASPAPTPVYTDQADLTFADLEGITFTFSSGAGAWQTEMTIFPDGSFEGHHHDADMGDAGEGYPAGTRYYCFFSGQFSALKKVGPYEYAMTCESLEQKREPGEMEISDEGVRYIVSVPYGMDDVTECRLYLPGKKIADLPEGFLDWIWISPGRDPHQVEALPFYGFYNVAGEEGFKGSVSREKK